MSKFAVMVFPDEKTAYEGLHVLQQLHAEGSLTVWGTDVLQRAADGRISILKRDDEGPVGTSLGVLTGALVGLFGGPVGAAIGASVGAAAGSVRDVVHVGVTDEFLTTVERDLAPGTFAVIAEISEEWIVPLDTRMADLGTKVVREDRLAFEEEIIEKRVTAKKAHLAQLKAERAGTKAEGMMQELLADEIEDERRKLESMAEKSEKRLDSVKQELDAKIEALLAQASGARPEVRRRIEQRMTDLRNEFAEREQKLTRATELRRQALQP
jgi:uncharacterized membrane protein